MAKEAKEAKLNKKYYRSSVAGLSVVVGDEENRFGDDPTLLEKVRFSPFEERFQGDPIKVGYLATDNPRAIEVLSGDFNVTEITEKEYNQATGEDSKPLPY